jgi:parvulin-like peptidyl-prolyl isomerase
MNKILILFLLISMNYCSSDAPNITANTLAAVNNRTIEKSDFLNQTQSIAQTPGVDLSSKDGRINILKDMVNEELVFQEAVKKKFYLENLEVKHSIVREYLKSVFGNKLPTITDEQVEKFYKENQNNIDQVRASHILIATKDVKIKRKNSEAKAIADKVRSEIVSGKISFADAVKKYSEDSSKDNNSGDLGLFPKAKMVYEFSKAAFELKKIGDISPVIKSDFGYHIILLTGDQRGYDIYKEKIRWKLYQDIMKPQIDEYFKTLREPAKIELFNDKLATENKPE